MQLTIRDLTRLMNASEATVSRWIKQQALPAKRVGGQYRVNRAELLEWATANNVKVSLELFDHLDVDEEVLPSLGSALQAGGIHYQVPYTNKEQALRAVVQLLPLPEDIDRELILRLFLAREESASTAIGDGIAIPHVRNPIVMHVAEPTITLAFLAKPIEFGALDGKPVHVLFSIVSPTTRSHLQLLARLSFALHDQGFRNVVKNQSPAQAIIKEVRRIEAAMTAAPVGKAKAGS